MRNEEKIRKSLKYSILDGVFASIMIGFGRSFLSAFAIFLKATNLQIGLIGSLPLFVGSILQLFSNRLIRLFKSRKRLVLISALLESLMYIPIALVFFLGTFKVFYLILFICLYWIFALILSPAWNSWMGDLVHEKERGNYFGRRNKIAGFASFISILIAGYILQSFSNGTLTQYIGFVMIFCIALIARIISLIYLTKKYEPRYKILPEAHFSFIDFIKQARFRNYGLFVLFLCLMNFAIFLAAPFFVAYMLYDLKFSYMNFTIISATSIIFKYLFMPIWGKASDQFGTRKVLSLSSFLMPAIPLLWLFSKNIFYLILIESYAGIAWAGFEISSFNFIFDTTTPQKRATCVAYSNVLNGIFIFLGAIVGALIVKYNNLFWSKYYLVFLLSFIFRYAASFIFVPKLREVREVEHISYKKLFLNIVTSGPTTGLVYRLINLPRGKAAKNKLP